MTQALQQSESAMAQAGAPDSGSDQPQEMSGTEGFNADGTPKNGGGKGGSQAGSTAGPGGAGPGLGGPGHGGGGKIPPLGAPTPGKKGDTLIPGQKSKGEQLVTPYRGA